MRHNSTIVSGAITAACFYMVYMAFVADDHGGIWMFAAFGLLFAVLPLMEAAKMMTRKRFPRLYGWGAGRDTQRTSFVPHWQLIGMIALVTVILLLAILIPWFIS